MGRAPAVHGDPPCRDPPLGLGQHGHLFPEVDNGAAAKLEALRNFGLPTGAEVY
jgi:hypothetical protein